jgi:hypothetical protein
LGFRFAPALTSFLALSLGRAGSNSAGESNYVQRIGVTSVHGFERVTLTSFLSLSSGRGGRIRAW